MRIGHNPHRNIPLEAPDYLHQVIIPVYIPNEEGYFEGSFAIFKLCLKSIFETAHDKTFITIVNNGSYPGVRNYLDQLLEDGKIHEVIHTGNIGKINAVVKGLVGHKIELVTIADADVLFLSHWQLETNKLFKAFPKAGVVGLVPQFKTFNRKSDNTVMDHLFSKKMRFLPITNIPAMENFYKSIGWTEPLPDKMKLGLGLVNDDGVKGFIGCGHFVSTFKRDIFEEISTYFAFKLGGDSEANIDSLGLKKDYYRLTTYANYAYHLGNHHESWMDEVTFEKDAITKFESNFPTFKNMNSSLFYIKNEIFRRLFAQKKIRRLFYRYKKLPKDLIAKY